MAAELEPQLKSYYFRERTEKHPVRRAETIEPGKVYRTRGGEKVKIYSLEGKELHGAINHNNRWHIDTWNLDGTYLEDRKNHLRDIVITKPLAITPNTKYKARDGRPVQVFVVNRGSKEFPVVGAIKDPDTNEWVPRVWNESGLTKVPYGANNDIVVEWSET